MSIWAEVAGKREKREWQLEREKGEVGSGDLKRFPTSPRVVEGGWRQGESFASECRLGGGRK